MNPALQKAMRASRTTSPIASRLKEVLAAEQAISRMNAADHAELREQARQKPTDGFLRLWNGLVFGASGKHAEACDELFQASQLGCNNWRVGWYLAQSAKAAGNIPLVDE